MFLEKEGKSFEEHRLLLLIILRVTAIARSMDASNVRPHLYLEPNGHVYVFIVDKQGDLRKLRAGPVLILCFVNMWKFYCNAPGESAFRNAQDISKEIGADRLAKVFYDWTQTSCGVHPEFKAHSFRGALATYFMARAPRDWVRSRGGWAAGASATLDRHYDRAHQSVDWEKIFFSPSASAEPAAASQRALLDNAVEQLSWAAALPKRRRGEDEDGARESEAQDSWSTSDDWPAAPVHGTRHDYEEWLQQLRQRDRELAPRVPLFVDSTTNGPCVICRGRLGTEPAARLVRLELAHIRCMKLSGEPGGAAKRRRSDPPTARKKQALSLE